MLNPLTIPEFLTHKTERYCREDMTRLLDAAARKFTNAATQIVVLGYFPILSPESDAAKVPRLLDYYGIAAPVHVPFGIVFDKIVSLCMQFWTESSMFLQHAVAECNRGAGAGRVSYVVAPFSIHNAVFAGDPWLFGLGHLFTPQDEVIPERRAACDLHIKPFDIIRRESCYRASAGHPNRRGAEEYAAAILAALNT